MPSVDPRHLLQFHEIIRTGSFTRAAATLGLTQPALHQLHVSCQGRLRQPERGRRTGKGSGADDFVELQQMTRVDAWHVLSYQNLMRGGKRITVVYRRLWSGGGGDNVAPWRTNYVRRLFREF